MPKMIQIRNVPDDLHMALKVRAAQEAMTLSDYLTRELSRLIERRPVVELLAEAASDPIILEEGAAVAAVRDGRSGR